MADATFLSEFVRYAKSRTDTPPDFHLHAGLAALSVALGSKVWCHGWGRPIYPNLWSVVIAPSGYGKSVPLDLSQSLVRQAGLGDLLLPDSFSQEALYAQLGQRPTGIFYLQEFSAFLGTIQRDYNAGAMQWLTSVFDVPEEDRRILRKETIVLKKPCITILGASSPDWFAEQYRGSMLRGGFLARFLFCPSKEAGQYIGHPGPRSEAIEAGLAAHLQEAADLEGPADFSAVWPAFNDWDRPARERLRRDCPPEFSGMRSRAGLQVLKAAMLFHASREPESLTISRKDLDNAIKYVEASQQKAEHFLSEEVAHDRKDADRLRVMEWLRRSQAGEEPWSRALKYSHLSARDFEDVVRTLELADQVRVERRGGTRWLAVAPSHFTENSPEFTEIHKNGVGAVL